MVFVKCKNCGVEKHTAGRWTWICDACGMKQSIESTTIATHVKINNPQENPIKKEIAEPDNSQEQNQVQTQQAKVLNTNFSSDKNSGILSSTPEPVENILEIEEDKNIMTENKMTENKKEIFHCPECGAVVKEFEDCENCGAEMVWSTEED